jgi:hypothetical protein
LLFAASSVGVLSSSANPATFGPPFNPTATARLSAMGKVTFYGGATILGIARVANGQATLTTIPLPPAAAWHPSNGTWYIVPSASQAAPLQVQWGLPGDIPIYKSASN